jgi:TM2 domain-containing membrane protein YozV
MNYQPQSKQGWITAILNALIPGIGFLYLGRIGLFFLALFSVGILIPTGIGALVVWLVWIVLSFPITNAWNETHIISYAQEARKTSNERLREAKEEIAKESKSKSRRKKD